MKKFLSPLLAVVNFTAPLMSCLGTIVVTSRLADFEVGSTSFWLGLVIIITSIVQFYWTALGYRSLLWEIDTYEAVTESTVFCEPDCRLRCYYIHALLIGAGLTFVYILFGSEHSGILPAIYRWVCLPAGIVNALLCFCIGAARIWMRIKIRHYQGEVSYSYPVFDAASGGKAMITIASCPVRELADRIALAHTERILAMLKHELTMESAQNQVPSNHS